MKHIKPSLRRTERGLFIELPRPVSYFGIMDRETGQGAPPPRMTRKSLRRRLALRYRARRGRHRPIPWLGYLLASVNLVAIAFFVLDLPLGLAAKSLPPRLVSLAGDVTDIARVAWILAAVGLLLIVGLLATHRVAVARDRLHPAHLVRMVLYAGISVLCASIVVNALKYAIGRARPLLFEQYGIFGFDPFHGDFLFQSFPSAHSANAGAFFAALALLFPRFRLVFLSLGLWIAATRVIVGVHYPSDVIAGLALGAWMSFAVAILFARFGLVFSTADTGWPRPRLSRPVDRDKSVKNL